ncbi:hypothetical protein Godav_025614 [Gossypium davidsonii]|uniref:Uncharacterized protein n=1 Tax=Gossypium davidsonii TaxID=34287 RepID=A0A7J8TCK9_GOSDV|nr:hypothetical protein [Gossypium davidsonii]
MEYSKGISKKRRRPSLHPLMGTITRSKSQIHIHRNRSGKSRTQSVGGGNHQGPQPFLKKPKKSSLAEDSSVGYDLSIKDLRLRRVFSPSSTDGVIPNCLDGAENLGKSEVAGDCVDEKKKGCENGDFEEFGQSTPPDAEILGVKQEVERNGSEDMKIHDECKEKGFNEERNGINCSIKTVLRPCSQEKLFKTPGSFSYRRLLPYLMDIKKESSGSPIMGHCQKTEKDFEEKSMVGSNVEEALGDKSAASDCFLEGHNSDSGKELNMVLDESMMTLFNGEVKKFELQFEDPNLNCSSGGVVSSDEMLADDDDDVAKINVESPCDAQSLEVLDQTLSMVENKCESGDYNEVPPTSNGDLQQSQIEVNDGEAVEQIEDLNGQCLPMARLDSDMFKSETDVEKSMNETPSDKSLDTSPKNKLVPYSRLHPKLSKIPGSFSYKRLLPFLIDIANDYSCVPGKDAGTGASNCKSSHVEHSDRIRLTVTAATAIGLQQEQATLGKNAALDANQRLEETNPELVVEPPAMSSIIGAKPVSYQLPLETEGDAIKSIVKCANHVNQIEADSFGEASITPAIPIVGLRRGILKRNPPGCRGICTCLNCSSFRLHAERSFEFSRNQMLDAEEVALDLIKELSFLRNILEKSAFGAAKDQSTMLINEVKEACKKASKAEEVAKSRLGEMNYDLNIHCRMPCGQRPRVRFASYVEEQVIPIADSSNK